MDTDLGRQLGENLKQLRRERGLTLVPGDYEFLTLQEEIKAGATLEQMEYHWINPDADQLLQQGQGQDVDDKQRALACIRVDEAGLAEFYELFCPERYGYEKNAPCCEFRYPVKEHLVELSFRMNEAGLSKMGTDWLRQLKDQLDSGEWLTHIPEGEPEGTLVAVFVEQNHRISLGGADRKLDKLCYQAKMLPIFPRAAAS